MSLRHFVIKLTAFSCIAGLFIFGGAWKPDGLCADLQSPRLSSTILERFKKSQNLEKLQRMNGAVVVTDKGAIIYKILFGYRNGKKDPITSSTLFPLASCTKSVSSALIALLLKKKLITLDEKIYNAITNFDSRVTLRQSLSHTSGFNGRGDRAIETNQGRGQLLRLFEGRIPDNPPGSAFYYNNVVFSYLEELIEKKIGITYRDQIIQFLRSIGISGEEVCEVKGTAPVAYPHIMKSGSLVPLDLPKTYPTQVCSSAGLFLSIDQVAKFLSLMSGNIPEILEKTNLQPLFRPQVEAPEILRKWPMDWGFPISELTSHYGLGWRILEWKKALGHPLVFHSGSLNGISTTIALIPELGLGIGILSNQDEVPTEPVAIDLWKAFLVQSSSN